jgi:hypothetical protein
MEKDVIMHVARDYGLEFDDLILIYGSHGHIYILCEKSFDLQ